MTHSPLIHLPDEFVDVPFSIAVITSFDEVLEFTLAPSTSWVGELKGPQEV